MFAPIVDHACMSDEVQTTQANEYYCPIGERISGPLQMPRLWFGCEANGRTWSASAIQTRPPHEYSDGLRLDLSTPALRDRNVYP